MQKSQIPNLKSPKISNAKNSKGAIHFWSLRFRHWTFQQGEADGFTLLEMIISIGIFSVLVTTSIGVMLGISNAQLKAANIQATVDNIRFSMELMTKEMRTGSQYALSAFCSGSSGTEVSFFTSAGERRMYYLNGDRIMRLVETTDCNRGKPLMADEVAVERLHFKVGGAAPGSSDGQPWVMVAMSVISKGGKQAFESRMDLETMVVQRLRDL